MLVKDCKTFNPEFPEQFTWGHVDSPKLSDIANTIRNHIELDLRTYSRNFVPGLREALLLIAEVAEVYRRGTMI